MINEKKVLSLQSQKDEDGDLIGRHANAQRTVRSLRHFPVNSPSLSRFEIERSPLRRPSGRTIDKKRTSSRRRPGEKEGPKRGQGPSGLKSGKQFKGNKLRVAIQKARAF